MSGFNSDVDGCTCNRETGWATELWACAKDMQSRDASNGELIVGILLGCLANQ